MDTGRAYHRFPLNAELKGYIYNTARKNYWRVAAWYDFDDLVADGYEMYCYCCNKYPDIVDIANFMYLFKLAFSAKITDLANARTRTTEVAASQLETPENPNFWDTLGEAPPEMASLGELAKRAPAEVRDVLRLFLSDVGLSRMQEPYVKNENGVRETTNEHLCRLTGRDPNLVDLVQMVRNFLLNARG